MASGNFAGTTGNQYIYPEIYWSAVSNIDGNYSDVTATLYYSRSNSGYTTTGTWSGGITVNGSRASGSRYIEISYHSETMAISTTVRVYHDADGSKSIVISADGAIGGTSLSSTSISATVTLDTIPRATTAAVGSLTMGMASTITLDPASSSFTHTLTYAFGSVRGTIATKTSSKSISWTPPKSLAEQIPRATVGIGSIYCTTYNGDTEIGTVGTGIQIAISDDTVPTISAVSISDAVSGLNAKFSGYVQSKSKLSVAVTATGIYGSSVTNCEVKCEGVAYNGTAVTTGVISGSGSIAVSIKVTDSRGRSSSTTRDVTVLAYSPPIVSKLSAKRITTAAADSDEGTRLAITMAYAVASVNEKNDRKITLYYRKETDTSFAQISTGTAETSYSGTQNLTSAPVISVDDAYIVRVVLQDYFTSVTADVRVESSFALVDYNTAGKGLAIGKASTKSKLEVALDTEITGAVNVSGATEFSGGTTFKGAVQAASLNVSGGATVVGTTATGTLTINGNTVADSVIEQGTSGAWTYRKWASGIAECWRDHTGQPDCSATWGALYESQRFGPLNFPPGLFAAAPTVLMIPSGTSGANVIGLEIEGMPTATQSAMWYYLRAATNTVTMTVAIAVHALGRWK